LIRQILDMEKPDAMWIMTDPRFYTKLFAMSDEVKKFCPIIWNSIWDNLPVPHYNKPIYDCIDFFGCINKVMFQVTQEMGYSDHSKYIPHGVPEEKFKILDCDIDSLRKKYLQAPEMRDVEFVLFYNSRNALRKRTGNVIMAYKLFRENLPPEEQKKVFLCMNTPVKDPEGQDLIRLVEDLNLRGLVAFSENLPEDKLNDCYNIADVTIIQSSEEGFGLSCLESLMCGTPVIAGATGGISDQLKDPDTGEVFGVLMEPDASTLLGSQATPYIYSHHFDYRKTATHINDLYQTKKSLGTKGYKEFYAGTKARESMLRRFGLKNIVKEWEDVIIDCIEKHRAKLQTKKTFSITSI
jgi:glycosyltransferase involved in cell wall biosynthesis